MRRLRLGRREALTGQTERPRYRFWITAPLLLTVAFLVGFVLFFPFPTLQNRIEQAVADRGDGVRVAIGDLGLRFPPGLQAQQVRLRLPTGETEAVTVDRLAIAPLWGSLLGDDAGLTFRADLFDGVVEGAYRGNGATRLQGRDLVLDRILPGTGGLRLQAVLRRAEATTVLPPQRDTASHLQFTFEAVRLSGLENLGLSRSALDFGDIALIAAGEGRSLQIERATASGGDIEATLDGLVVLSAPFERSRLNLSLSLRPGESLAPGDRELLAMLVNTDADGVGHLRITGTVARPRIR